MNTNEVLKLALEALEMVDRDDNDRDFLFPSQCYQLDEAITALREALAEQPAQQALDKMAENARELGLDYEPAQQEPVAWMYPDDYERMTTSETFCTVYSVEVGSATRGETTVALYTSPPAQRTWVGLTDEEVKAIFDSVPTASCQSYAHWRSLVALAIETKLREKNT